MAWVYIMVNKCILQNINEYTSGQKYLPALRANQCREQYRWGTDSNLYKSVSDKNNVYKWTLLTPGKLAQSHWKTINANPMLYGAPYNFKSSMKMTTPSQRYLDQIDPKKFCYGTLIDVNLESNIELTRLDNKEYTLRDGSDRKEQERYLDSNTIFEWYGNLLDDMSWDELTYLKTNPVLLVDATVFDIGNTYINGVQLNIVLLSEKPLGKDEIRYVLESTTQFDNINKLIKLKANKIYTRDSVIYTKVGDYSTNLPTKGSLNDCNYKVTTWKNMLSKNTTNKTTKPKTIIVGKEDPSKIPTYPIMGAVLDDLMSDIDDIPRYFYPSVTKYNSQTHIQG